MKTAIEIYQTILLYLGVATLGIVALFGLAYLFRDAIRAIRESLSYKEIIALSLIAIFCTYAAQKRLVTFPRTDPTQSYLIDNGSYVDTDTDVVHINFRRLIVPDNATMYIDRIDRSSSSSEWENQITSTFGEITLPLEFTYENATNYRWIVYTDWTPGPTVQTNGVWHANWGRDSQKRFIIPVRTEIRTDGVIIASPKSRMEQENEVE